LNPVAQYASTAEVVGERRLRSSASYPIVYLPVAAAIASCLQKQGVDGADLLPRDDYTRWSDVVPLALGVPLAIGASRIALGKHWPTDVLGGFATGIAVGALTTANRRAHVVGNGKPIAG
jgi:hypothetical protein